MSRQINTNILEINGESNPLHFILETAPSDTLSSVIGSLKCKIPPYLLNKYSFPYWGKNNRSVWSSGYFVSSTGGSSLNIIKKYIQNQSR